MDEAPWAPPLSEKQLALFNCYKRYVLCSGGRRNGKCVDAKTLVRTPFGVFRMKSFGPPIDPGQTIEHVRPISIYNESSHQVDKGKTVIFYRDPKRDAVRFSLHSGYEITTSTVHPLWTCCDGVFGYRKPNEIQSLLDAGKNVFAPLLRGHEWECEYQSITFSVPNQNHNKRADLIRRIENSIAKLGSKNWSALMKHAGTGYRQLEAYFNGNLKPTTVSHTTKITEDVAYLLGVLCGDGCISKSSTPNVRIAFSSADSEIVESVAAISGSHFGCKIKSTSGCDHAINQSHLLRGLIFALGMDKLAHEKSIPDAIIQSPKPVLRAFLQGLFDTDGHADKLRGWIEFCSSSENLAKDVHQCLLLFGVVGSIYFKKNDHRGAWILGIRTDSERFHNEIGFRLSRKRQRMAFISPIKRPSVGEFPPCIKYELKRLNESRAFTMTRDQWKQDGNDHWKNYIRGQYVIGQEKLSKYLSFLGVENDERIEMYRIGGKAFWRKIEAITPCESDLYDVQVEPFHNFIGNGVINHNTLGTCHRVWRHLWETPGARVAIIATTIKSAKEGGAFADLIEYAAPIWLGSGMWGDGGPIEYTSKSGNGLPGPRMDPATRTSSFRIRNLHGGESELMLFSIDNENDIEAITKSKRFSMVWISEGSNFKSDKVFKNVIQMLRMVHLKPEQHQLIIDTNPAEEGEEHWIYQKWYIERIRDDHPEPKIQKELALFEFQLEDNPFLTEFEIAELKASNCDNQGEYDRNVLGLWKKGFGLKGKVFADIIDPSIHFIGEDDSGISIDLDPACIELITGWDPGAVNNSAHIVEKRIYKEMPHYMVIEEFVSIDERISTEEFAIMIWEKMRDLEQFYQKRFLWRHWSDDTALNVWRPGVEGFDATVVYKATQGEISLVAVDKPKESVRTGTKIMRRAIREKRLFVGANCPKTREMLVGLTETDIEEDTALKHPFDSLRYVLYMEERTHYMESSIPRGVNRDKAQFIHVV